MVFVPVPSTLQVELRGTVHGVPFENVLYFTADGTITTGDVDDLFDFFENEWVPAAALMQGPAVVWNEAYGTDLTTQTSPVYVRSFSPPIQGNPAGDPTLPGSVAFTVSFRTAGRGRSSRGRNYVTGLTEGQVTANLLGSGFANSWVALYGELLGVGTFPPAWDWVVVSRISEGEPRAVGLAQTVTDVTYTDLRVDTMRSRLG